MLVPETWTKKAVMPQAWRDMYAHLNSVMEPWDGPAALCATDGRWVIAGMDRNGLRPMRYTRTLNGLLIAGSEAGMVVVPENNVAAKGRLGPGQMIAVDLNEGAFFTDQEIKDKLASDHPYGEWVKDFKSFEDLVAQAKLDEPSLFEDRDLKRRQIAAGLTLEDMELILHPMAEDGKEAIGSMGDDTPVAVISDERRPMSHFFRQNFSQVTNPPIDSLRESRVMSLKTRFGNFANLLDHDVYQSGVLVIDSPVITNAEWSYLRSYFADQVTPIDCTFPAKGGVNELAQAIKRIRQEAEDSVRAGQGHLFLSDEMISDERAAIPMIAAVGAIHSHLMRKGLRTYSSLNVRSGQCLDTHYFAVLIGVGATTVNAYLAQEAIRSRHQRGLFGTLSFVSCLENYRYAIGQGILKIMSKMGISVLSSYRGGYHF